MAETSRNIINLHNNTLNIYVEFCFLIYIFTKNIICKLVFKFLKNLFFFVI